MKKLLINLLVALIPGRDRRKKIRRDCLDKNRQFDRFQSRQMSGVLRHRYPECVSAELQKIKSAPRYLPIDRRHNYLNLLLGVPEFDYDGTFGGREEVLLCWEIRPVPENARILKEARRRKKRVIFAGDAFLRSFTTFADQTAPAESRKGISFTLDDITSYFDATLPSRLEQLLNDRSLVITEAQKARARDCINKIVATHLTKYNHQPIYRPVIGRQGARKILVVDQVYNDMSILKGMGGDRIFKDMLASAIRENPGADIIVKTHPDTMAGGPGSYYAGLRQRDNIYPMTEPINPIALVQYVDKVYVCTTQLGFEALMCGKEVEAFGLPFYAGWGLTHDRQHCGRRKHQRDLAEMFYIAYIMYSHYVNPATGRVCQLEEAMDYLLEMRNSLRR